MAPGETGKGLDRIVWPFASHKDNCDELGDERGLNRLDIDQPRKKQRARPGKGKDVAHEVRGTSERHRTIKMITPREHLALQ